MYNNIGGKIKILAKIICCVGIVLSVIAAIIFFKIFLDENNYPFELFHFGLGVSALILGPLFSWISTFVLYGFGELIEKTSEIAENTSKNNDFTNNEKSFEKQE